MTTINRTYFSIIILLFIFISGCKNNTDNIPNVYVDIVIDLNDPQYSKLTIPGNFEYITGGVNGIIVYRKSFDEFTAFERTCPYDPSCGKVFIDETGYTAKDTICCKSEFSIIIDGAVSKGPSQFPLRNYSTQYNPNSQILRITN